jgi:hypothetical protein
VTKAEFQFRHPFPRKTERRRFLDRLARRSQSRRKICAGFYDSFKKKAVWTDALSLLTAHAKWVTRF